MLRFLFVCSNRLSRLITRRDRLIGHANLKRAWPMYAMRP